MGKSKKNVIREYAEAIIIAILIALFIRTFVVQAFKIPSGSMKPTLLVGDHLLVNKFVYGVKIPFLRKTLIPVNNPERGDIVVFIYPVDRSKDFIKRVVGVAGDTLAIKNKRIYINGSPSDDGHGVHTDSLIFPGSLQPRDNFGPVTVPPGHIFVMGDNRDESYDSRFWGFVDLRDVLGKAFIIYWSWDRENSDVRWKRMGRILR
ncbi:MAG: signal peptidase I [Syntrophaceae bacterium]|nr:signal peptidase I [Syntrophaceae bacterium]